jgi:hypothetical protein
MTRHGDQVFVWSDAWLLAALAVRGTGPRTLGEALAGGDALQHAIMTRQELNGALGRLGRAALVVVEPDGRIRLSSEGAALCSRARGPYAHMQAYLEAELAAAPWTPDYDPRTVQGAEPDTVSASAYAQVVPSSSPDDRASNSLDWTTRPR